MYYLYTLHMQRPSWYHLSLYIFYQIFLYLALILKSSTQDFVWLSRVFQRMLRQRTIARFFKHFTPADNECHPMELSLKGLRYQIVMFVYFNFFFFSSKTGPVIKPWTFTVMFSVAAWTLSSHGSIVSHFTPRLCTGGRVFYTFFFFCRAYFLCIRNKFLRGTVTEAFFLFFWSTKPQK